MSGTDTLIDFLTGPRGADLMVDFLAEVGGDPEEYGLDADDVTGITEQQLGAALQIFMERAIGGGVVDDPDVVSAVHADVDWTSVAASSIPDDDDF